MEKILVESVSSVEDNIRKSKSDTSFLSVELNLDEKEEVLKASFDVEVISAVRTPFGPEDKAGRIADGLKRSLEEKISELRFKRTDKKGSREKEGNSDSNS
ncbi:hypothetical protein [Fervidicoccus fontis]|jgi:hypothetical protein|uniref:Uncharacterized protein n=1 Tax=Fervidicoccus fontis (strain DSM 19380 / JCM 18336 / VKM B-2539 / Kam940) TaxID=1163730 RepID=I0A2X6_FERFK|nr:hypothetical protein [Fervidicoccus fontis]AFH43333.1 hypothetical protein FFONT_1345 [Fervidicoccus fontis Kam940]